MFSQHQYAAENRVFDMNYLIDNMREQLAGFYQENPGVKPLQMNLVETGEEQQDHYEIHLGDLFKDDLFNFFQNNGVEIEIDLDTNDLIRIRKDALAKSKLTYRDAHEFLCDLHSKCDEKRYAEHQAKPC